MSASWNVPADATSGIYFAKLVREDAAGSSHVFFIVRDDDGRSDLLFQTSDTTWQAYNRVRRQQPVRREPGPAAPTRSPTTGPSRHGARRRRTGSSTASTRWSAGWSATATTSPTSRASTATGSAPRSASTRSSCPSATTSTGRAPSARTSRRPATPGCISPSSAATRCSGRRAGRTATARWSPTRRRTRTPRSIRRPRVDGHLARPAPSVRRREARPENALTGTLFSVNSGHASRFSVPAADGQLRLWRNAGRRRAATARSRRSDGTARLRVGRGHRQWRPARRALSACPPRRLPDVQMLLDHGSTYGPGTATHRLTLYRDTNGAGRALVFGAGTVQWSWGLDGEHDRGNAPGPERSRCSRRRSTCSRTCSSSRATLQTGLTRRTASTDTTRADLGSEHADTDSSPPAARSPSAARPRTPAAGGSAASRSRWTAARPGTRQPGARAGATPGHRPSAARSPSAAALSTTAATWREPHATGRPAWRRDTAPGRDHARRAARRTTRPRRGCAVWPRRVRASRRRLGGLARALPAARAAVPRRSPAPPRKTTTWRARSSRWRAARSRRVSLRLTRSAHRRLVRSRALRVVAVAVARDAAGNRRHDPHPHPTAGPKEGMT